MIVRLTPFPHAVVDGMWDPLLLHVVLQEFPDEDDPRWTGYSDSNLEVKLEGGEELWGPATRTLLDGMSSKGGELSEAFGLPPLVMRTAGGGMHYIPVGGKLAVHADFNRSEDGLFRRLNMIVYLNEGWTDADGGLLELWDHQRCVVQILPAFNRTVVFTTSDTSYHGHPTPLPGPRPRRSVATYFFSSEPPADYRDDHSTSWFSGSSS